MPKLLRRAWTQQPSVGATVNLGHPLAQGMSGAWIFNQGGGGVFSLVNPGDFAALRTNSQYRVGAEPGVYDLGGASTNSGVLVSTPSSFLKPAKSATLLWRGMFLGAVAGGIQNPRIASMDANATDSAPFVGYGFYRPDADNVVMAWNNGTFRSSGSLNRSLSSRYFAIVQLAIVHNGESGTVQGYDGAAQIYTTSSLVGTITYAAGAELIICGSASKAASVNGLASSVVAWNRALRPEEIEQLAVDPYAWVNPPGPKILIFDLGAGVAQITDSDTGNGAEVGTIAATLTDADTGTGVDAGESLAAALADTETATGTDGGESLATALTDSDTAGGLDAGESIVVHVSDNDTGTAVDAGELLAVTLTDADIAAFLESEAIAAALVDGDTGAGVDAGSAVALVPAGPGYSFPSARAGGSARSSVRSSNPELR